METPPPSIPAYAPWVDLKQAQQHRYIQFLFKLNLMYNTKVHVGLQSLATTATCRPSKSYIMQLSKSVMQTSETRPYGGTVSNKVMGITGTSRVTGHGSSQTYQAIKNQIRHHVSQIYGINCRNLSDDKFLTCWIRFRQMSVLAVASDLACYSLAMLNKKLSYR